MYTSWPYLKHCVLAAEVRDKIGGSMLQYQHAMFIIAGREVGDTTGSLELQGRILAAQQSHQGFERVVYTVNLSEGTNIGNVGKTVGLKKFFFTSMLTLFESRCWFNQQPTCESFSLLRQKIYGCHQENSPMVPRLSQSYDGLCTFMIAWVALGSTLGTIGEYAG